MRDRYRIVCFIIALAATACQVRLDKPFPYPSGDTPTASPVIASVQPLISFYNPSWSPAGSEIVTTASQLGVTGDSLVIVNAELSSKRFIFGPPERSWPTAMPGTSIAPARETGSVLVVTVEPHAPQYPEGGIGAPVWSPDGSAIAFYFYPEDSTRQKWGLRAGIYTVDPDGQDLKLVVAFPEPASQHAGGGGGLSWSPDGQELMYVRPDQQGADLINLIRRDGSDKRTIKVLRDLAMVQLSPDGQRIAYTVGTIQTGVTLHMMSVTGTDDIKIVDNRLYPIVDMFAWSPDSRRLVFAVRARSPDVGPQLAVVDVDSGATEVIEQGRYYSAAAWSPSGKWLVLSALSNETRGLVLVLRPVDF